jgi:hypothetical protein
MNIHTACPLACGTHLSRPNCPHCGSLLLIAEQSAFNPDGNISHSWLCDECGEEFTTSVRVLPRKSLQRQA